MAKKPNSKSTKAEILEAYEELQKEKSDVESQLKQLQKQKQAVVIEKPAVVEVKEVKEAKTTMTQPAIAQKKMENTIQNLSSLQLGFGSAISELSEKLTSEASQLQELRGSVAEELQQLNDLHALSQVNDETLDTLIEQYENSAKSYQEEINLRRGTLEQELLEARKAWEKEQEEHKRAIKERNDTQHKARQRNIEEYRYDLELQRKLSEDTYEQTKKALNKELEEIKKEQEKVWTEREKAIAEREKEFNESKDKVEAFPKELEAAIKKAKEEGKGIANYQAKVKGDLLAKEVEGQKRFYELRLQSLEETIQNQQNRIQSLSKQLESTLKQVQDLAVKAIEGASNVTSSQVLKEIAIEQAKGVQKGK